MQYPYEGLPLGLGKTISAPHEHVKIKMKYLAKFVTIRYIIYGAMVVRLVQTPG